VQFIISANNKVLGQHVIASNEVELLIDRFKMQGKLNEQMRAWRIQIITTDDRREMEAARSRFSNLYPGVQLEWKHVVPYYQVRVGAYENKLDLMPFLLEVKKVFPSATPVNDMVNKKTLVNN
jgi:hypothetical protein